MVHGILRVRGVLLSKGKPKVGVSTLSCGLFPGPTLSALFTRRPLTSKASLFLAPPWNGASSLLAVYDNSPLSPF